MNELLSINKNIALSVNDTNDHNILCKLSHALSVPERVKILQNILSSSKSVSVIAKELDMPVSSVARHIQILAEAQLIFISYQPGLKGHTKFCSPAIFGYSVSLGINRLKEEIKEEYVVELPIGLFSHCHIKPPCGMNGKDSPLGGFDNPSTFFSPDRVNAENLWFDDGYISYNFPANHRIHSPSSISFSFEICSETIYYNNNWPSDITISVNNVEVATFTSSGDFGGRRGKYTPEYWPITSTQFGILKKLTVDQTGVYIDNILVNKHITFSDLRISNGYSIQFTIGVKENAVHKGGINLFGKNFGDHQQAIIMTLK